MNNKNDRVFGYVIEPDIQVNIPHNSVINMNELVLEKNINVIVLRKTMMRLFLYLLENADGKVIANEEILLNVWDKYGLSSSSQRLWQVMRCLRNKLATLGIPDDFIIRVEKGHTRGFYINQDQVKPIYYLDQQKVTDGF